MARDEATGLNLYSNGLAYPIQGTWLMRNGDQPRSINLYGYVRNDGAKFHAGWDIDAAVGTEVWAIRRGTVTIAGVIEGYGNCVQHSFTFNKKTYYALYAHLSQIFVKQGQVIELGFQVGLSGITGNASNTDPHLHFQFNDTSGLVNRQTSVDPAVFFGMAPPGN
jgi:murein DD-endopeptidase MepM/ murein hydrolase activator NlpD